jgi:hypothetical protein
MGRSLLPVADVLDRCRAASRRRPVKGQNVLRALVRRVLVDKELAKQIVDDLDKGKGQP